jgi:dipeptidyl aminopeptidase/acylaminoacyl peptidase
VAAFDTTAYAALLDRISPWVAEWQDLGHHRVADLSQAAPHPHLDLVACAATLRPDPDADEVRRVLLVAPEGHRTVLGERACGSPVWSPDGSRLCVLAPDEEELAAAVVLTLDGVEVWRTPGLGGTVEVARWSADGSRLAMVVADPGAEISDVWGSGVVGGADDESWRPQVFPHDGGRRRLVVWEPATGSCRPPTSLNVWEADFLGDDLVALVSEEAGEGAWYDARLVRVGADGSVSDLHRTPYQLARPTGCPDGSSWSVLSGFASDRDLLAGSLVVARRGRPARVVETAAVHVTDHRWVSGSVVLFIGHRGLDTVLGTVDVDTGAVDERWSGPQTTGRYQPELGGLGADGLPVVVLEHHHRPPALVRLGPDGPVPLLSSAGPGSEHVVASLGETRIMSWTSTDGWVMEGLLDLPRHGTAPYALVVHVHGGPVGAHQDGWLGRDPHTAVLLARGYAVLRPNPRGSAGRGAAFAEAVREDMGGLDVHDILTGVDALVSEGLVDRNLVGITGQSYGGFMAAWMPCLTDLFRASVSRSPCTDWRSFHLTTNIAEFDSLFLKGAPFDPDSQYQTRNPLTHHARISTPMLLTAGALDLATPASQAQQMYRALADRGVPTALAIYPEEGHGVQAPAALADQCARMVAWFELFMPADR